MDVASLSPERGTRPAPARGSTGTLQRPARRPRVVPARPEPQQFGEQPSVEVDPGVAAADNADQQQADYFLHLLAGRRRLIDHRVNEYQKAVAVAEANRDAEAAGNFRRMVRLEIQDRQTVDGMIEKLQRRFTRPADGDAPAAPQRARLAVR